MSRQTKRLPPSGPKATPDALILRASLLELISLDSARLPNGTQAYVVDEQEVYSLDTENAFTVCSDLILARTVTKKGQLQL